MFVLSESTFWTFVILFIRKFSVSFVFVLTNLFDYYFLFMLIKRLFVIYFPQYLWVGQHG
jgi:hypothetical protein